MKHLISNYLEYCNLNHEMKRRQNNCQLTAESKYGVKSQALCFSMVFCFSSNLRQFIANISMK